MMMIMMNNNKTKSQSHMTDGHLEPITRVVSSNTLPRIQILSQYKMPGLQPVFSVAEVIVDQLVVW
jgi:hypothetical protein